MELEIANLILDYRQPESDLKKQVAQVLHCQVNQIKKIRLIKKSLDSRKKPAIFYVYTVVAEVEAVYPKIEQKANVRPYHRREYQLPPTGKCKRPPVIVGTGPAGLFCGLILALNGLRPILIERGQAAADRAKTIVRFNQTGVLNPNSNICFGEGGAGTFSDGKLNTGVKDKFLRKQFILEQFVRFGADESILISNKPHIGTDYLIQVVQAMRQEIIALGGQVIFNGQLTDLQIENQQIRGVQWRDCSKPDQPLQEIETEQVVLAIGHSARDTFQMLADRQIEMESKPFAVGLRIEHPQQWINYNQYGAQNAAAPELPAADYKLTHQTGQGRGVYSFCMCPGGTVVNSASEQGQVACNGMSAFDRSQPNANSAIIVTVGNRDFDKYQTGQQETLKGLRFQQQLERAAFACGGDYRLPIQRYQDFYQEVTGRKLKQPTLPSQYDRSVESSIVGGKIECSLTGILPPELNQAIVEGIESFAAKIRGFNHPQAILTGVESRTSSPIRIIRGTDFQASVTGLYPAGEGAGHAGGIMSAAIDGIKVAEAICHNQFG